MIGQPNVVEVAALIGDVSRSAMLMALMDGRIRPASELARLAKVTPQTASSHLSKLVKGGLLAMESHGRHRYYRLAGPEVAEVLEGLTLIAPPASVRSLRESEETGKIRYARTCYDHLAGAVGIRLTQAMLELGYIQPGETEFQLTPQGAGTLKKFGIDVDGGKKGRSTFAKQCLDWSERRHHVGGALGAAVTERLFELGWIERLPNTRAVAVTEAGEQGFWEWFGIKLKEQQVSNL